MSGHTCPPFKVADGVGTEEKALQPNMYKDDAKPSAPTDYKANPN